MAQVATVLNQHYTRERPGNLTRVTDLSGNDSDKTLTVPANELWKLDFVFAAFTTTATQGDRQILLRVSDGTYTFAYAAPAAPQPASSTELYHFGVPYGSASEDLAGYHFVPLPVDVLPAGYELRIYDVNAVDAAADDLTIRFMVNAYHIN